jgi:O-antigen/teichoic acid export membrane protein
MKISDRLPPFLQRHLTGRDTVRGAMDNSFWLFCDQLLRMVAALFVGVWMARYLGPERYGWLSYALALAGVVSSFTSLGINAVVVRELVRVPGEAGAWLGTAFFLRSAGAAVGFMVCVVVAWVGAIPSTEVRPLIVIVSLGTFFQALDVIDLLFQARGESRFSAWGRMVACVLANGLKVVLILGHSPLWTFAAAGVAELAVTAAGWWWIARRREVDGRLSEWRCEWTRAGILLRESWPLALGGLAIYVQAYSDQLVIGSMLGGEEVGQYSAALRLVAVFSFVPMVVQIVAAPEITRARRDNETLYEKRLHSLYRLMFGLFLLTAIPITLLGPVTAKWLYGASYAGAAALLPWMGFRLFFTNVGIARGIFITNEGLFRFGLLTSIAGAAGNLMLNLILVPRWGARGAIIASFVSFGITTFALEIFQPRARWNLRLMMRAMFLPWRSFP